MKLIKILAFFCALIFPITAFGANNLTKNYYKISNAGTQIILDSSPAVNTYAIFRNGTSKFMVGPLKSQMSVLEKFKVPLGFEFFLNQTAAVKTISKVAETKSETARKPECYFAKLNFDISCSQAIIDEARQPLNIAFVFERSQFANKETVEAIVKGICASMAY